MGSDALFSLVLAPAQQGEFRDFVREHFPEANIRPTRTERLGWNSHRNLHRLCPNCPPEAALKLEWR